MVWIGLLKLVDICSPLVDNRKTLSEISSLARGVITVMFLVLMQLRQPALMLSMVDSLLQRDSTFGVTPEFREQTGGCRSHSVTTPFVTRDFPRGSIKLWSGAIADIPLTWRLCDGTRFTPDLRDRFIVGAGDSFAVDDVGGTVNHMHDFTGDGHVHVIAGPGDFTGGGDFNNQFGPSSIIGTTDAGSTLPPYHALVYIMYDGRLR